MRVLTVIDSLIVGGAEQSLLTMTPPLMVRGVEPHVAYLVEREGVGEQLAAAGASLHSLTGGGGRPGAVRRTLGAVRSIRPDLVHTTLFEADVVGRVAGRLAGVPVVSSFVTESYGPEHYGNPEYLPWKVRAAHMTDAVTARLATRFHAVSLSSADLMAQRLRIPRSKIDVIPRGRDPEKLGTRTETRRRRMRSSLGIADGRPLLFAAGRHFHFKGLDVAAAAMRNVCAVHPEARLLIAGRYGPATAELRSIIASVGKPGVIELIGYRRDVPDLMAAADVFVLPSRAEGSPGVLLEAMALEAPVVASDIPSVREIAGSSETTMVLTPPDAPERLAAAIIDVLGDDQAARSLAAAARRRFLTEYTIDSVADRMVDLYRSCLR